MMLRDALARIMLDLPYDFPSANVISLNIALYNDYVGTYDHPAFKSGCKIEKKGGKLYLPDNRELCPVGKDQFMVLNCKADNIVYTFIRDEQGRVVQLRIKGGGQYFEVRCQKI